MFSSLVYLSNPLLKKNKELYLQYLANKGYNCYDYDLEKEVALEEVLVEYANRDNYPLRLKGILGTSYFQTNDDFFTARSDENINNPNLIIENCNYFCEINKLIIFGKIDEEGDAPKNLRSITKKSELKWLFKYNYFGKAFIEKFGKDFFINMPCVKYELISDDIIRVDLVNDIFDDVNEKLKVEINQYLEKHSQKVRFYDHKQH
jgi:hypothetical protein